MRREPLDSNAYTLTRTNTSSWQNTRTRVDPSGYEAARIR